MKSSSARPIPPSSSTRRSQQPRPVLAVDIDEVLTPFMADFCLFLEQNYGAPAGLAPAHNYYGLHEITGQSFEELVPAFNEYNQSPRLGALVPFNGVGEVLTRLHQDYRLVLITSRSRSSQRNTERWVDRHFPGIFESIHFVGYSLEAKGPMPKRQLVADLRAVAFVDDNLQHVAEVAADGCRGILFGDYSWNRSGLMPAGVVRAKDWSEVEALLTPPEVGKTMPEPQANQFSQDVYALVAQIPRGRVMTYGQIAALCGSPRSARIVGQVAHWGPLELPWQRVVNKNGGLAGGYTTGGRAAHRRDLEAEGVAVADDDTVDVAALLWWPPDREPAQRSLFAGGDND